MSRHRVVGTERGPPGKQPDAQPKQVDFVTKLERPSTLKDQGLLTDSRADHTYRRAKTAALLHLQAVLRRGGFCRPRRGGLARVRQPPASPGCPMCGKLQKRQRFGRWRNQQRKVHSRLFGDHNVSKEHGHWIYRTASSNSVAREVEQHFLDAGMDGGPGGGDATSRIVYAYKKTPYTNP
jgi:hypothetical protein